LLLKKFFRKLFPFLFKEEEKEQFRYLPYIQWRFGERCDKIDLVHQHLKQELGKVYKCCKLYVPWRRMRFTIEIPLEVKATSASANVLIVDGRHFIPAGSYEMIAFDHPLRESKVHWAYLREIASGTVLKVHGGSSNDVSVNNGEQFISIDWRGVKKIPDD